MIAVLQNGSEVEIDTKYLYDDQYTTLDGIRIFDKDIQFIKNDKRKDIFIGGGIQGTYAECLQAITEQRSKIDKCGDYFGQKCFWLTIKNRVAEQCSKKEYLKDGVLIVEEKTAYSLHCGHKAKYCGKCVYDIDPTPKRFIDVFPDCFFLKYPQGVPDNAQLIDFIYKNANKFDIEPCFSGDVIAKGNEVKCSKKFGSYELTIEYNWYGRTRFILRNNNNKLIFNYDLQSNLFIVSYCNSYKIQADFDIPKWQNFKQYFNKIIADFKQN